MVIESTKAVGSTRLRRVQFGVPPNCIGAQTIYVKRMNDGAARGRKFRARRPKQPARRGCYLIFSAFAHFRD